MRSTAVLVSLLLPAAQCLVGCGVGNRFTAEGMGSELVDPPLPDGGRLTIPIRLGEMAFNEANNDGYLEGIAVGWTADTLLFTSGGRVRTTLEASYDGPTAPGTVEVQDALFWTMNGRTVWDYFGDAAIREWAPVTGVRAISSDTRTASFRIDGWFQVPPLEERKTEGMTLTSASFELTWVRAWSTMAGVRYQVLAGPRPEVDPESMAAFDEVAPTPRRGRFLYYQARPVGAVATGGFDYVAWFETH